jgi:hypothetical protein
MILIETWVNALHDDSLRLDQGLGSLIGNNLHLKPDTSIALIPLNVIIFLNNILFIRQGNSETEFGLWVNGNDNNSTTYR